MHDSGYVPYDTCLQYAACSAESKEGDCASADYTCKPMNVCRTCSTVRAGGARAELPCESQRPIDQSLRRSQGGRSTPLHPPVAPPAGRDAIRARRLG